MKVFLYIFYGMGGILAVVAILAEGISGTFSTMIRNKREYNVSLKYQIKSLISKLKTKDWFSELILLSKKVKLSIDNFTFLIFFYFSKANVSNVLKVSGLALIPWETDPVPSL